VFIYVRWCKTAVQSIPLRRCHVVDQWLVSVCLCTLSQSSCRQDSTTQRRWCQDVRQWHWDARQSPCSIQYTAHNRNDSLLTEHAHNYTYVLNTRFSDYISTQYKDAGLTILCHKLACQAPVCSLQCETDGTGWHYIMHAAYHHEATMV